MATQEQVTKLNFYVDTGVPQGREGVCKINMYAIVNTNNPPPPPPPFTLLQADMFTGRPNH